MTQKNETPILLLTILTTIALLGGAWWWFSKNSAIYKPTSNLQTDLSSIPLTSNKGIDYTNLRDDLQKHDWKLANQDTTEALLKAFGPKSNLTGHIDLQEAQSPPCDDLKTIDKLWTEASNGNLGFTAQRQVLKEVGNDYRQAYNKMQWQRPGGEWLIQYVYDGHREHFKPGYEPDYSNPDKGNLPTIERGYNFKYSFDGSLSKCGL